MDIDLEKNVNGWMNQKIRFEKTHENPVYQWICHWDAGWENQLSSCLKLWNETCVAFHKDMEKGGLEEVEKRWNDLVKKRLKERGLEVDEPWRYLTRHIASLMFDCREHHHQLIKNQLKYYKNKEWIETWPQNLKKECLRLRNMKLEILDDFFYSDWMNNIRKSSITIKFNESWMKSWISEDNAMEWMELASKEDFLGKMEPFPIQCAIEMDWMKWIQQYTTDELIFHTKTNTRALPAYNALDTACTKGKVNVIDYFLKKIDWNEDKVKKTEVALKRGRDISGELNEKFNNIKTNIHRSWLLNALQSTPGDKEGKMSNETERNIKKVKKL